MSVDITLNIPAFNDLRNSQEVMAAINTLASRIADAAGDGFVADPATPGTTRAHARVYPDTIPAKLAAETNHALQRGVGGA
jgi:hypothetical protein